MPISRDRFEAIDEDHNGPTPGSNAATILAFLRDHPEAAFTQTEIAEATDVSRGSVGPTLVRLRERGRVDHRGTYWGISDHERAVDAATSHSAHVASSHEPSGNPPEYEEWQAYATDPRADE